jgi:hypothetical protein
MEAFVMAANIRLVRMEVIIDRHGAGTAHRNLPA